MVMVVIAPSSRIISRTADRSRSRRSWKGCLTKPAKVRAMAATR
jgi:hypothetical protein